MEAGKASPAVIRSGGGTDKPADKGTLLANYPSLKGRTVLITGGASGIGEELVRGFVRHAAG